MSKITQVIAELRDEETRLKVELARVQRVLEVLEEALDPAAAASAPARTAARPAAPYAHMDLYEAAAEFLASATEPQTARQIADALAAGGFKTRSLNFASTVRTMLRRRPTPGIRATGDGNRWIATGNR